MKEKGRKQGKIRGTSRKRYIKEIRVRLKQLKGDWKQAQEEIYLNYKQIQLNYGISGYKSKRV